MEKSNKRRYTLIVISFLFLLVATFVTVYNFKDTRAEETDAVVSTSTKATCKGASNFVFRSDGISGCEMTINTLKNISGFQQQKGDTDNDWEDIKSFTLDTEYGIKMTDKRVRRYNSKYESYSDPWDYPADNNYTLINYSAIDSSTICSSETFCCAFKLSGIDSDESQKFRNKGNFHMIFNYSYPNDSFKGEFVYAFPSTDIGSASLSNLTIDYYNYENNCMYAYNQPLVKVTIDDRGRTNTEYYQVSDMTLHGGSGGTFDVTDSGDSTDSTTSIVHYSGGNVYIKYTPPTRIGYVFDGFDSNDDIVSLSNNYYKLPIKSDETAVQNTSLQKTYKMIERKLTVKWKKLPSTTVTFNFNAPDNVSSGNCTCDDSDKICLAFDNNPTDENFEYVVSAGSSIQLPTIRCPGINKKIKDWSGKIGNFKPTANTILKANWVPINSENTPSNDEYTVTLNRNCSGTFVCSSTTNSEVCTQLKNNGKFIKTVTKGDTFVFPKTFDTLTCDGKEISSWGSFDLGYELNVTSDVTASAKWKSSSGGGNTPSNDEYTVTLNRNCSGTFVCSSTTNSEVCTQLKNNGKFIKTVTKGDTFVFPKTFDTLTCDGKEISSWGSFDLGYELNVTSDVTASAKWKSSSGGGNTPSNDEYTVTLNRNCSGTFVCNSTTNSSVCEQLKSNGKFIKTVTKGDTFIFPKTFDALTCDGKEISSWGSYSLGTNITVNKNIDIDAAWESSNGGGDTPDPSQNDDPIDNPQTGSIVIYLVLLFGIGALVYSVWYFRGFREN